MLIDIYHQEDQFSESANAYIEDSLKEKSLESRIRCLSRAKESLDKALLIPGAGRKDNLRMNCLPVRLSNVFDPGPHRMLWGGSQTLEARDAYP